MNKLYNINFIHLPFCNTAGLGKPGAAKYVYVL